jgi:hypothetical protein
LNSLLAKSEKILYPLLALGLLIFAYQSYEWMGVVFVVSACIMWALLHFSRMLQVFRKASNRPIGYVDSAVMINAKLKLGVGLLHVIALTKSLGEKEAVDPSPSNSGLQQEVFTWRDGSNSVLRCVFENGKLSRFSLTRPEQEEQAPS